jgi:homoserine dehydrogenase
MPSIRPCRIAIAGFGTVGAAVARRLADPDADPALVLTHVFDRRAHEKRARLRDPLEQIAWTDRFEDLLAADVDVIVEAIGGVNPATDWIRSALLAGKSVVTSNKQVMARQGAPLLTLAARQGRQLRFEAAVGGAMPIVRVVGGGLAGDRVLRIAAILNGTTNAVLSDVEARGATVDEALDAARRRGYAERDASVDLDGGDACAKLAILCAVAFGIRVSPDEIDAATCASLTPADVAAARRQGRTIRQIAWASFDRRRDALTAHVGPASVAAGSLFARTVGPQNAAIVTSEFCGSIQLSGAGAGGDATAVAILSDLLAIARDRAAIVPAPQLARAAAIRAAADGAASDGIAWIHQSGGAPLNGAVAHAEVL